MITDWIILLLRPQKTAGILEVFILRKTEINRIRRALRKQIHSSPREFSPGDKLYYKRPDSQEWKGPGTVIGQDGPVVFVRHGGTLVRVHKCRLQSAPLLDSK